MIHQAINLLLEDDSEGAYEAGGGWGRAVAPLLADLLKEHPFDGLFDTPAARLAEFIVGSIG